MDGQRMPERRAPETDPAWLRDALSRALRHGGGETGARLEQVRIRHIWNGQKQKTILYDVQFSAQDHLCEQLYAGYVVAADRFAQELGALKKRARVKPPHGPAIMALPQANLILLAYPNDPKMQLLSGDDLVPWARRNLRKFTNGQLNGRRRGIDSSRVEILQYVPGKRFTARCRFRVSDGSGRAEEVCIVAKQLKNRQKSKSYLICQKSRKNSH
jgi:hypothetical protein